MELPEPGVHFQVVTHVVHPTHVPLQSEAQAAILDGPGDLGPGGGLLRRRQGRGIHGRRQAVQVLQKRDGLQIFMPPVNIGPPLRAAIVQIQHGRHGVHPQAVDVVFLQPPPGGGQQEGPHVVLAEVKDPGAPALVLPLQGVAVFIQAGAVKVDEAVGVLAEVGGDPVQDHRQPRPVQPVHQIHEVVGVAVAAGGGEIAHALIAPGVVQGILRHRQQLHGVVAHAADIGGQPVRQPAIVQERPVLSPLPGTAVDLIDVQGSLGQGRLPAALPPHVVVPVEAGHVEQAAGGVGPQLGIGAVGVRLPADLAVGPGDDVFIAVAGPGVGNGQDPVAALPLHGNGLPVVEVTGQGGLPGAGGIDPEGPALPRRMRAIGPVKLCVFGNVHGMISLYQHNVIITAPKAGAKWVDGRTKYRILALL